MKSGLRAALSGIALACLASVSLVGCEFLAPADGPPVAKPGKGPRTLMYGVKVTQVVNGRVEVEILAERAWHSDRAKWLNGRKVRAFYHPEGRGPATLRAAAVRYEVQGRWLEAWGKVLVESEDTKLETEELKYDSLRQKITTRKAVKITRGENVITGEGLQADPDLGNLEIGEPHIRVDNPEEMRPLIGTLGESTGSPMNEGVQDRE